MASFSLVSTQLLLLPAVTFRQKQEPSHVNFILGFLLCVVVVSMIMQSVSALGLKSLC